MRNINKKLLSVLFAFLFAAIFSINPATVKAQVCGDFPDYNACVAGSNDLADCCSEICPQDNACKNASPQCQGYYDFDGCMLGQGDETVCCNLCNNSDPVCKNPKGSRTDIVKCGEYENLNACTQSLNSQTECCTNVCPGNLSCPTATSNKKSINATCTKNDDCQSNYCSSAKKCAVPPVACGKYESFQACLDQVLPAEVCCDECSTNAACKNIGSGTNPVTPNPSPSGSTQGKCEVNFEEVSGLCVPKSTFDPKSLAGTLTLAELILRVLNYLLILSGMIAVVALVIGGFWYITAAGNDEQAEKGQKALTNAIIGLIIVILAYAIVNIVTRTLTTDELVQKVNK